MNAIVRLPAARPIPVHVRTRKRVEDAIERLIALLDAMDAPTEDIEPEPVEDDTEDCCPTDWAELDPAEYDSGYSDLPHEDRPQCS